MKQLATKMFPLHIHFGKKAEHIVLLQIQIDKRQYQILYHIIHSGNASLTKQVHHFLNILF